MSRPRVALTLACVVIVAVEAWLISPRFSLSGVALLDDWWYVVIADPHSFGGALKKLFIDFGSDPGGRFRPAINFWSYVQWRLTGAPDSVIGSHVIQAIRQAFFLCLIGLLPAFLIWRDRDGPRLSPKVLFVVTLLPASVVLGSQSFGIELFGRLGSQEPGLIGETLAGGMLILAALKQQLARRRDRHAGTAAAWTRREIAHSALTYAAGFFLLALGAVEKEASVAFLALLPFVYLHAERTWRAEGVIDRPLFRYREFHIVGAACVLPFVREAGGVIALLVRGAKHAVYATTTTPSSGLFAESRAYFSSAWTEQHELMQKLLVLFLATVVLLIVAAWRRRGTPMWLEIGFTVTAVVFLLVQSTGADRAPRYAMPTVALLGIACALLVARFGSFVAITAAAAILYLLISAFQARPVIAGFVQQLQFGVTAVHQITPYDPPNCPVYMASVTGATALAVPMLAGRAHAGARRACLLDTEGVLLSGQSTGAASWANESILKVCATGWQPIWGSGGYAISSCKRLRSGLVNGRPVAEILRDDRLIASNIFLAPTQG